MKEFDKWVNNPDYWDGQRKDVARIAWKAALEWVEDEFMLVDSYFDFDGFRHTLQKELEDENVS